MQRVNWRESTALLPTRWRAAKNLWKGRRSFLGIDIGRTLARLVEIERHGATLAISQVGEARIDGGSGLAAALADLLRSRPCSSTRVAAAVPGVDVISKRILVDVAAEEDLEAAIQRAAVRYIPESLDQVSLDYQVLGPLEDGRKLEVLLVAARANVVAARAAKLREIGLRPEVMDVESFALGNAFLASYDPPSDTPVVLLHLGEDRAAMNVLQEERSLLAVDFSILGTSSSASSPDGDVADLVDEIHHAISFYWPLEGAPAGCVYLSGAEDLLARLRAPLAHSLERPVEILDPFRRLALTRPLESPELRAQSPRFSLAVGLALRGFQE